VEAVGVKQAQTCKVTFLAELFGRSREQQDATGLLCQCLDEPVFGAGMFG